jgi:uncharacterized membrane protein YjfL (UPF0719 family)
MQVCRGAHEMPLPQSLAAGAMVGMADTLQTSIAIMNNDAFIGYVCWLCLSCIVLFLLPIYYFYFYSCMNECMNMMNHISKDPS